MNHPFLYDLAERILKEQDSSQLHRITVVLPSRRSGLFLRKYLSQLIGKPFISPRIITINEIVESIVEIQASDSSLLLFELYETYRKIENTEAESFEFFSKWGQVMLNDFNEIDRYLVDPKKLFRDLKNIQELEDWSFNEETLSPSQEKYRSFWLKMGEYYQHFADHCQETKIFSSGYIYRKAASLIEQKLSEFENNSIYFAGFNAISKSEEKIIDTLCSNQKAVFITDADAWYAENKNHEAGIFIRQLQNKEWFATNPIYNHFSDVQKNIKLYSLPGNTLQASTSAQILSGFSHEELTETVLVLADENLLLPVIHSLPENVQAINITMGYSLRNTTVFTFIHSLFEFQKGIRVSVSGEIKYYVPYIMDVLYNSECASLTQNRSIQISESIRVSGKTYLRTQEISELINGNPVLIELFEKWESDPKFILNRISSILEKLHTIYSEKNPLQQEFVFTALQAIRNLQMRLEKYSFINEIRTLQKFCIQILKGENVPFFGEPLRGLQIIGMLESRALDFKNIIILSANEGVLPQGNSLQSLIPYDLKKYHHLPTWVESDAVFAHHFYRLIQRAENVHLLYNSAGEKMNSSEKSRFILQIEEEFRKLPNIKIEAIHPKFSNQNSNNSEHNVKNNPEIIEKIKTLMEKGISPSAISTFIDCPLDFYYKYVIGIREKDNSENIDASRFGNVIHNTIHHLYSPYRGVKLEEKMFDEFFRQLPKTIEIFFLKEMNNADISTGKNYLAFKVLLGYCEKILMHDKEISKNGELIILETEKELSTEYYVNNFKINIKGTADRIDSYNGQIRLVDYKSGHTEANLLKVDEKSPLINKTKAIQLLIYAMNYLQETKSDQIIALHYGLRQTDELELLLKINGEEILNSESIQPINDLLEEIIPNWMDENYEFTHTIKSKYCSFCE